MKYLKYFESKFPGQSDESVEDVQTLKEILLDLTDVGYHTQILVSPIDLAKHKEFPDIVIVIKDFERILGYNLKINRGFKNKKRDKHLEEETKLRIIDYMGSQGYKVNELHIHWQNPDSKVYTQNPQIWRDQIMNDRINRRHQGGRLKKPKSDPYKSVVYNDPCHIEIRFTKK